MPTCNKCGGNHYNFNPCPPPPKQVPPGALKPFGRPAVKDRDFGVPVN